MDLLYISKKQKGLYTSYCYNICKASGNKMEQTKQESSKEKKSCGNLNLYLIFAVVALVLFNQWQITSISRGSIATGVSTISSSGVIPTGIPAVYGKELNLKYDDVSVNNPSLADAAIKKMAVYDNSITLTGDNLKRYIETVSQISCEYCCGAQSIIFSNGKAACGCAHSGAMRGLAKYLFTKHPEMTNDQILEELGKWKTLFFPEIMAQKAGVLKQKGIELNYINLASNKYRGIEKGQTSSGSMVGGC